MMILRFVNLPIRIAIIISIGTKCERDSKNPYQNRRRSDAF